MITLHKEGKGSVALASAVFAVIVAALLLCFGVNVYTIVPCFLLLVLLCCVLYFFRDPHRDAIISNPNELLSSADGKVVIIKEVEEDEFLKCRAVQVSVFMSVFNVHVNYYPSDGKVIYVKDHPGDYLVAWHPKSSVKNERTSIVLEHASGAKILVRQIAGYVARRIVCYAQEGSQVAKGEQLGFIKFGSRVDFFLPLDSEILVKKGDKVKACRTVIAKLRS